MNAHPDHISYQLLIHLDDDLEIGIGALGIHQFPAGNYIYTGSARRNLAARIRRHLSPDKRLRWHIDYLLVQPSVHILEVTTSGRPECAWNQLVCGTLPVPGFGASDCRKGCGAHLVYLGRE